MAQGKKAILKKRIKNQIRDGLARKIEEKIQNLIVSRSIDLDSWEPTGSGHGMLVREVSTAILLDLADEVAWTPETIKKAKKLQTYL